MRSGFLRRYIGAAFVAGAVAWSTGCVSSTQPAVALQPPQEPRLFWSDARAERGNLISSAKLDGSDWSQAAIRLPKNRHAVVLAAANGRVYWAGYNDDASDTWIGSARADGTDVRQRQFVIEDYVNALAVSGRRLYIATPEHLERVRLGSKHPLRALRVVATGLSINSVAVGGKHVYWGDDGPSGPGPSSGTIHRAGLDGSHSMPLRIAGLQQPACLMLAGPYLFWGDFEANRIGRVSLDGSGAATFLETAGSPVGLASHAGTLYWAANANGGSAGLNMIGAATFEGDFQAIGLVQSLLPLEAWGGTPYSLALG